MIKDIFRMIQKQERILLLVWERSLHAFSISYHPRKAVKFCVRAGVIQTFFFLFLMKAQIKTSLKSDSYFSWELLPSLMLQNLIKQKGCPACLTAVPRCTTGCFTGSTYLEVEARVFHVLLINSQEYSMQSYLENLFFEVFI